MASRDPVALDVAAVKIAGVNPKSVRHILLANKEGTRKHHIHTKRRKPRKLIILPII